MNLPEDPQHPVYIISRFLILVTAVTVVLWANASDFDVTEGKSIGAIAAIIGAGFTAEKRFFDHYRRRP